MSQSAFDSDFWLKKPHVEVKKMSKKKKKKQKLRFEAKVEATLAAEAEAEAEAEEIMMAGESEERMVDKNQKSEINTEITAEITAEKAEKNTEIASATTQDFEKSQKMKKSFERSVLAVEQAIIEGNPIDNQHFMIVIYFSLFGNYRH